MKIFRRSKDVDNIQNVEKEISAELSQRNKEKYKLIAVEYRQIGNDSHKSLVMDFVHVPNEAVKNFVWQASKKKHPEAEKNPDEYGKKHQCPNGQKYVGYIYPKPEKFYLFFYA